VVAADVYAVSPHTGLGGWTWYTGSAAWMYRLIVESLLGFSLDDNTISFTPNLPQEWNEFEFRYRYRNTFYQIKVARDATAAVGSKTVRIQLDGVLTAGDRLVLLDDLREHQVEVSF
jgi:cellobiose phosphorylase